MLQSEFIEVTQAEWASENFRSCRIEGPQEVTKKVEIELEK